MAQMNVAQFAKELGLASGMLIEQLQASGGVIPEPVGTDITAVVEQLAEFLHRVAHVGAQHVLAEELVEHLADG